MKTIQILGPGCPNCRMLAERVDDVVGELGLDCRVEKITDIMRITEFGVLATPALAVDGKVLTSGRIPSRDELIELLQ
jgi:small redox-active disulfide protein 2